MVMRCWGPHRRSSKYSGTSTGDCNNEPSNGPESTDGITAAAHDSEWQQHGESQS